MSELLLGINIDHVATIRNARGTQYPNPIHAALVAEQAGADKITIHLREDRRHINDYDVRLLRQTLQTSMNLEMAITNEMIDFACEIKPQFCCLVPERRQEVTTEGGLDIVYQKKLVATAVEKLTKAGINVSLFIDPDIKQIDAALDINVPFIELHTGAYANAKNEAKKIQEYERIKQAVNYAAIKQLKVNAGHGLTYHNVYLIAKLTKIREINIGHAIIGRAIFSGLLKAVHDMKKICYEARQ